jgi:outer membrane protein W
LIAQNDIKHFEIGASVNFWTPTSLHFESNSSVSQLNVGGSYFSTGSFSGYGTTLAPELNIKYYFKDKIGISLGFYMVHMDNELFVQETDSTSSSYENLAEIPNVILGITGQSSFQEILELFYETGLDFIPGYGLEMQYANESSDPPDLDANGMALGVYGKTGANFKIFKFLKLKTALMYSFIPAEIEYTTTDGSVQTNVKTNFGGISLEIGLATNF